MTFGAPPIDPRELASLLIREVPKRAIALMKAGQSECPAWTRVVKQVLNQRGADAGYEVYCSGIEGTCEWLLDVLWWRKDRQLGQGIELACESEWDPTPAEVSWDFHKLLCVKAPLKLLIYTGGGTPDCGEKIRATLKNAMESFRDHVYGEIYLFVSLDYGGGYAHRYVVPSDGMQAGITLELLADAAKATA